MNPFKNAPASCRLLHKAIRLALLPAAALYGFSATSALAALPPGTKLVFDDGSVGNCTNNATCNGPNPSYFTMQVNPTTLIYTGLQKGTDGGLFIGGVTQTTGTWNSSTSVCSPAGAACSHGGVPYDIAFPSAGYTTDHGPIDTGWGFFGNTGLHFTTTAPTVLVDSGTAMTLDFSGWYVTWNGIPAINMGGGLQVVTAKTGTSTFNNGTGIASLTCTTTCADGGSFVLDYSAVVPQGDPSNFGGVPYTLHMAGTIAYPANTVPVASSVTNVSTTQDTQTGWTPNVTDPDTYRH